MNRLQLLKYSAILVSGTALSLYLFYSINYKYVEQNKATIESATSKATLRLTEELKKINLVMGAMAFFFENIDDVSPDLFESFTTPILEELNGIGALEWAPKITESSKKEYIKEIENSFKDFTTITKTDSVNKLIISEPKKVYFPITYINPLTTLQKAIGYDHYSDKIRKSAIDEAIKTRRMVFTGPVELILQNKEIRGFLAMQAVFDPKLRIVNGVVAGAYRMDTFIGKTLASELKVIDINIYDKGADNTPLYHSLEENTVSNTKKSEVKVAGRIWEVHYTPKAKYLSYPHSFESYIALILGLLATGLIAYILGKREDYYSHLEERVRSRTAELEESNILKENLLREIHHRVKNNLQITSSLMNMQKRKLTSKEAIAALQDSQARISAIALTHQKIYQDKDSKAVNLYDYLKDLMEYQQKISPSFSYKIECPEISIDLDRAVPLALIISELVTNAVRHAYPDTTKYNELLITVVRLNDQEVSLTVLDNGQGLPVDFDIENAQGIGFEIIRALCRQIGGKLTYESNHYGTKFNVDFENRSFKG